MDEFVHHHKPIVYGKGLFGLPHPLLHLRVCLGGGGERLPLRGHSLFALLQLFVYLATLFKQYVLRVVGMVHSVRIVELNKYAKGLKWGGELRVAPQRISLSFILLCFPFLLLLASLLL